MSGRETGNFHSNEVCGGCIRFRMTCVVEGKISDGMGHRPPAFAGAGCRREVGGGVDVGVGEGVGVGVGVGEGVGTNVGVVASVGVSVAIGVGLTSKGRFSR